TKQEMRYERTPPDGRVVEVRRNAVPGGGFVLIYADITERKHAEQAGPRCPRRRRNRVARFAGGAGEPRSCTEDGSARTTHRRNRPRDQEPSQFRQQL